MKQPSSCHEIEEVDMDELPIMKNHSDCNIYFYP